MTSAPNDDRTVLLPESRRAEVVELDRIAFATAPDPETDAMPLTLDWTRTAGVERSDGTLVGVHSSYPFTLPVPGSSVPCSGLTWVGVRPDHRRRGVLSAMIATHFERSVARREPVSALFAAEAGIYGRFGYGSAADNLRLTLARGAALRDVARSAELSLRLERADPVAHVELVHALHAAAGAGRPGWIERRTESLRSRHLADTATWRDGAEELQLVTVSDAVRVRGYALYRRKAEWGGFIPSGVVRVLELAALDAPAAHRLWSFLLDLDLMATVETPMLAADDVLLRLLVDPRVARPRVTDNRWVRLLDVPAALAGRRYAAPLDVVLEVTDARVPANAGSWRLRTLDDGSGTFGYRCEVTSTSTPADLALDVRELGAAYLGGRSLASLAAAGLVVEKRTGAALRAAAAFGWPIAPLCSWVF